MNYADSFLTQTQTELNAVIPAQGHAASSLSYLWNNPPGHTTTLTTVSVPPPTVTDQHTRNLSQRLISLRNQRSTEAIVTHSFSGTIDEFWAMPITGVNIGDTIDGSST